MHSNFSNSSISQYSPLEKKESENLFFEIERERNLIKFMSLCPRVENKESENLFFK
jgi:hypothetical protein